MWMFRFVTYVFTSICQGKNTEQYFHKLINGREISITSPCLGWSGMGDQTDQTYTSFPCMEYKTDDDRAVNLTRGMVDLQFWSISHSDHCHLLADRKAAAAAVGGLQSFYLP